MCLAHLGMLHLSQLTYYDLMLLDFLLEGAVQCLPMTLGTLAGASSLRLLLHYTSTLFTQVVQLVLNDVAGTVCSHRRPSSGFGRNMVMAYLTSKLITYLDSN